MNTIEKCFSAGILSINNKLLTVLHRKYNVTKLPGGTQNGDRRFWEERGEGGAFYNPHSSESVIKKIKSTIINAFGIEVEETHNQKFREIFRKLLSRNLTVSEIHLVVEFIEETGVIPLEFNLSLKQLTGEDFHQYFYEITKAFTFSKDRNAIIEITDLDRDLPKADHDFFCRDMDIDRVEVLDILDVSRGYYFDSSGNKISINTAHKHKNAINGYIMNIEKATS